MGVIDPEGERLELTKLHKAINTEDPRFLTNWNTLLRRAENLKFLRDIFNKKMRSRLRAPHFSAFLVGSKNVMKVSNTVVMSEIEKISKSLMSSHHRFQLNRLKPRRRKVITLGDCFLSEDNIKSLIERIFTLFKLKEYIGETNCKNTSWWVRNVLYRRHHEEMRDFVYKEASFARAFRAKKVMKSEDPSKKRDVQREIIENVRAAICWWTLAALKQVMVPIQSGREIIFLWRRQFSKLMRQEFKDFRKQYQVRRVKKDQIQKLNGSVNGLKFMVINKKFRPIFKFATRQSFQQRIQWKMFNSMIGWCMKRNGIEKPSILKSCSDVYKFLKEKTDANEKVDAFTSDVTKCYSTVDHQILDSLIDKHMDPPSKIYTVWGIGKDSNNRTKLLIASGSDLADSKKSLKAVMTRSKVEECTKHEYKIFTTSQLSENLKNAVSSYFFNRGETVYKIGKGVPQGHPFSSNFSHMYLSDFEEKYWSEEKNDSRLIFRRFEDDIIFYTTEGNVVQKMLKPLFSGDNEHKLTANREKCRKSGTKRKLRWCGVRMNLKKMKFERRVYSGDRSRIAQMKFNDK